MGSKLQLLLLLTIVIKCNGHLGILTDIITTAHDRVHDTAKSILGGFTAGFHFGGHGGMQQRRPPPNHQQPGSQDETIIVVVEEKPMHHRPHQNGYRPPYQNNGQETPHQYGNKPYGNGYNMGMGDYNNNGYNPNSGRNPNYQQGNYYMPGNNYGNNYNGYNKNPGQADPNYNNNQGYNSHYNNNQGYNSHYNNNQGLPSPGNNDNNANEHKNVNENPNDVRPTEYTTTTSSTTPVPTRATTTTTTTKKPDDDEPFFLPLDTGYVYTGDKIYTGAPKREADTKPVAKDDDDDFKIDIRLKKD